MTVSRKTKWGLGIILLVVAVLGIKHGRHYVIVDNFGVVETGKVYRSGQLKPYQLEALIRDYGLKTVINTREEGAPIELMDAEGAVCESNGVDMIRISMPGDGRGTYAQYEQALAVLTDTNRLPALVHCARGTHRTGAIVASYRVRVQGWDADAAIAEMSDYRFKPDGHVLTEHLRPFLQDQD